jgi:flavorubredoxin
MTSTRALRYALEIISKIPFEIIAPQHGSVIKDKETIKYVFKVLGSLQNVGIDGNISEDYAPDFTNFFERWEGK